MEKNQTSAETTSAQVEEAEIAGASEIADASNEAEFTDTTGETESVAEAAKEVAPKSEARQPKTNSDYARERRKAEREAEIKKARYDAIIEALDGENPYTHEKIEDARDVEEFLIMKQIAKEGKDPINDYPKFIKNKAREEELAKQAKSDQEEWISNDKAEFAAKHPDVNLGELLEDELFKSFVLGKVGKFSMNKIFEDYQKFLSKSEERAQERAAQILANTAATPGKITDQAPQSAKKIADMSKAEFEDLTDKVKRGIRIEI